MVTKAFNCHSSIFHGISSLRFHCNAVQQTCNYFHANRSKTNPTSGSQKCGKWIDGKYFMKTVLACSKGATTEKDMTLTTGNSSEAWPVQLLCWLGYGKYKLFHNFRYFELLKLHYSETWRKCMLEGTFYFMKCKYGNYNYILFWCIDLLRFSLSYY